MEKNTKLAISAIGLLLVIGVAVAVYLQDSDTPSPSPTPITVRIGTMGDAVDYAPYMIAQQKGWFEEAFRDFGVDKVEYTSFQELAALNESLGTERTDLVFEAGPPAIIGRAQGNKIRIVGISCSLTQEIVVRADAGIDDVAGLRGKKATVPAGTSSHFNLLSILEASGLSDSDLEIIDMSPPDAKAAFEGGQVDAWAIWPPMVEEQVISGAGTVLPKTDARIHSVMSIREAFRAEHPGIAKAAIEVLQKSKQWIIDNPEEAKELVAKSLKLKPEVVELAWPKHDWNATIDGELIRDLQSKADFLKGRGLIRDGLDVGKDLVDPSQDEQPSAQKNAA